MTSADPPLAHALIGRYTLERELGQGGMATVYLAQDVRHHRRVAVKVLRPELAATLGVERFLHEIETAAQFQHPHILPLLDSGEAGGFLYYVMPYVEGESLRTRLARRGELPVHEAVKVLIEICDALAYAHERGIVHRDIKPDNVLLSGHHALVTDFGVAKALDEAGQQSSLTGTGLALGTPTYMAPEQAAGDPHIDQRADIYAFGVLAYEILTGRPPFTGPSAQAVVAAHLSQAPTPIGELRASVPSELAALIMGCLQKRPADRPQSATALLTELGTVTTRAATPVPLEARRAYRITARRAWQVGIGLAALLLTGLLAVFWPGAAPAKLLDPNLIAVVPFRTAGADPSLGYLREGMLDLLAAKLTGDGGPRVADPRSVMSAWRQLVREQDRDLPPDSAVLLARQLGAGQLLLGGIVGTQDRLVINASLLGVPVGGPRVGASVAGRIDSLGVLIDRLTGELLAREAGESTGRVGELTNTSLPALRAYLQGQAAYRRGRYDEAVEWFDRALEQDSTLAVAALGLVYAGTWESPASFGRGIRIARGLRERLSPRDRLLLDAFAGPHYPAPYPFVDQIATWQRAAEVLRDSPETWYQTGDALFHRAPASGAGWPLQRAAAAFRRAIELDSSFAAPLDHLIEIAVLTGDTAGVRWLGNLYLVRHSQAELTDYVRWRMSVVLDGHSARTQLRRTFDSMNVRSLTRIVTFAELSGIGLEDVDAAAAALRQKADARTGDPQGAHWALADLALNRGRPGEARDAVEATRDFGEPSGVLVSHLMNATFDEGDSAAALNALRLIRRITAGPPVRGAAAIERNTALCALGLWYAQRREWIEARRVLGQMGEQGPQEQILPGLVPAEVCAGLLEAVLTHSQGRPDARKALLRADSLVRAGWFGWIPLNLILARLWEAEGDVAQALAAVRRHEYDDPDGAAYLATRLRTEGRLAAVAGDRDGAVRAYTHYLALVNQPEPRVQPLVTQVRDELARLVGEQPPRN